MKKLLAALLTVTIAFSPVGSYIFQDHVTTADARSYKSGKRSFNTNQNNTNSFFQNKSTNKSNTFTNNKSTTNTKRGFMSGGFMKGMMLGGLAGLLFGGLFANMGAFGSLLGLLVNVLAIVVIIAVIRKIFEFFKDKKKKEDPNSWKN